MIDGIWQDFLKIVREEVGSRVVETWFKAVKIVRWDSHAKIMYVQAPNQFVKEWIVHNYQLLLEKHLSRLLNEPSIKVILNDTGASVVSEQHDALAQPVATPYQPVLPARASTVSTLKPSMVNRARNHVNNHYMFSTFVVGPGNALAYNAAMAVTEKPGRLYNPLFIYGGSGLGKTHLLHAIGNAIREQNKKAQILYQSADRFVNEFINAIRFDKVYQFEARYKDIDVLLVDDIQFISNKEQTQEAFFHIFNALHQSHKQIVFSSDSMPRDIAGLADRMRSRLEGGLAIDMRMPPLETKIAILKQKADIHSEVISDEVAHFIASHAYSNIRELEGALIRVLAFASLTQQPITLELTQKVLQRPTDMKQKVVDLQRIVGCVANHFEYSIQEIRSTKRNKELALARHVALYLMKKMTDHSLKEIGAFLARKDHSTVIHAYEKIESYKQVNGEFSQLLDVLERQIGA